MLVKELGYGEFGRVWKAIDTRNDRRHVAIKVLHDGNASDQVKVERFFRGPRCMNILNHKAVVNIIEPYCKEGGRYFFVMEYLEGGNLHDAVLTGNVDKKKAIEIVLCIADVLIEAHQKGIIHRDVKATNILLDASKAPKLSDFDLARYEDETGGTITEPLGRLPENAPEQLENAKSAREPADVYGLGLTAVFGISGQAIESWMLMDRDMLINRLECNEAVKAVLRRAISWDTRTRFKSVLEFRDALSEAHYSIGPPKVCPTGRNGSLTPTEADEAVLRTPTEADPRDETRNNPAGLLPATLRTSDTSKMRAGPLPGLPTSVELSKLILPQHLTKESIAEEIIQESEDETAPARPPEVFQPYLKSTRTFLDRKHLITGGIIILFLATVVLWLMALPLTPRGATYVLISKHMRVPRKIPTVRLQIRVNVKAAKLYIDGEPVRHPITWDFEKNSKEHIFQAEAPGYIPQTLTITYEKNQEIEITLIKK